MLLLLSNQWWVPIIVKKVVDRACSIHVFCHTSVKHKVYKISRNSKMVSISSIFSVQNPNPKPEAQWTTSEKVRNSKSSFFNSSTLSISLFLCIYGDVCLALRWQKKNQCLQNFQNSCACCKLKMGILKNGLLIIETPKIGKSKVG